MSYLQQPGRAEAEIEPDVRGWLAGLYTTLSADGADLAGQPWFLVPRGGTMRARFTTDQPPRWLSGEDFELAVVEFERTGFTAALNRYRCMDQDWVDSVSYDTAVLAQPSLFLVGEEDASRSWLAQAIDQHATTLPALRSQHVLPGTGHWVQQEAPDATSAILLQWLRHVHVSGP